MTIKELAQISGFSTATISNVINKKMDKISEATYQSVTSLIKEYNYIPNKSAKTLVSKSSRIVGVFFPKTVQPFLDNPFHASILSGIENSLSASNYYTMTKSVTKYSEIHELISNWNLDGIIIINLFGNEIPSYFQNSKVPMVLIDTNDVPNYHTVVTNDFESGYTATKYLIDNGHKDICFAGFLSTGNSLMQSRYQGFEKAMHEHNLNVFPQSRITIDYRDYESNKIDPEVINILKQYTACFVAADTLAIRLIHDLRQQHIHVPDDFSIVGFDNISMSKLAFPPLTTMDQKTFHKGYVCGNIILDIINNKEVDFVTTINAELCIRDSVKKIC